MNASFTNRLRILLPATCALLAFAGWTQIGNQAEVIADAKDRVPRAKFENVPSRNQVNLRAGNLPVEWSVEEGKLKNIKWSAEVGTRAFGSPVVANGKVFVATNNERPRDPNVKGKKAVLMAFREADGKFLWQITHDSPDDPVFCPFQRHGLLATPTVDDQRIYYTTPIGDVICADCDSGKILWRQDLSKKHKFVPYYRCACSPLIVGEFVYVTTGNGVDEETKLPSPNAPSFVALDKRTGKLVWESSWPGANIIEGQWSNPAFALVQGQPQVIFAGGDGVVYGFEPGGGRLLWQCDCLPNRKQKNVRGIDNYFVGTPVIEGDKLYLGMGVMPGMERQGPKSSWFLCLDMTKRGDVSLKSYHAKAPENKDSALVWAFGGEMQPRPAKGRDVYFGPTLSTAAVHDGLVYVSEEQGYLHCLDAKTGKRYWEHDLRASVLGSPYWADGKVYLATEDMGDVHIFRHGKERKYYYQGQLHVPTAKEDRELDPGIDMGESIQSTPVAANGVLYLLTKNKFYAIGR